MAEHGRGPLQDRRAFLKVMAMLGVGGQALLYSRDVGAAVYAAKGGAEAAGWPEMRYRELGRTGFRGSRLVFGCGAALAGRPRDSLLDAALDAGVNVFDSGTRRYYKDAESNLAPFLKRARDRIFLISKAMVYLEVGPDEAISSAQARQAASTWQELLEGSLRDLGVDHVDAYYLMAAHNPSIVGSEELYGAFQRAKKAGKVSHFGLSTHQNAAKVLETAVRTGWYDLAQIAITPAGWYDWEDKGILAGSKPMTGLQPTLQKARDSGLALIGMKAGRYLAGRKFFGWGNPKAFDTYYDPRLLKSDLSPFQRSYAFVLEHGLDAVNADMQSFAHLEQNVVAAATAPRYFA